MDALLPWLAYALLAVTCVVGLILNIVGLPGIWLIPLAAIAYKILPWTADAIGWWSIVAIVGIGVVAELAEFAAGAAGSAKAGGSKRSMLGAILGGVVGAIGGQIVIPVPLVGAIIGAIAGSFGGSYLSEYLWVQKSHADSLAIGVGAMKGRVAGLVIKSVCGAVMSLVALVAAWPG
jgi:uncharacterized protein